MRRDDRATWLRLHTAGRRLASPAWLATQIGDAARNLTSVMSGKPFARAHRLVRAHTMVGVTRLAALYDAVSWVMANEIPGDLVECGVARGGSGAVMAIAAEEARANRTLWLFDTFEGLPNPSRADPDYELALRYAGKCRGELEDVQGLFTHLGLDRRVRYTKGLFHDTLPRSPVGAIAVLHLDCDWHDSVKECLENLYDRVAPGGVIQFDDYGHWLGARKAVDEFRARRGITEPLEYIDYAARQLRKPI
ncbi:MAG TPA: TylF/MycF/NovP-related O-methyltransferase [Gemmatimonadaceae bacterium]